MALKTLLKAESSLWDTTCNTSAANWTVCLLIGVLSGIQALAIYIRSNNIPKFYDDRNLLAVDIFDQGAGTFTQDLTTANYKLSKKFSYLSSRNGASGAQVPLNHDQGIFIREMDTVVTKNYGRSAWTERTTHYKTERDAILVTYNATSPDVSLHYISRETDDQFFGEGYLRKPNNMQFRFFNFIVHTDVAQSIKPGSVKTSLAVENAQPFAGQLLVDVTQGTPFLYKDADGQLRVSHNAFNARIAADAYIQTPPEDWDGGSNNTDTREWIDWDSGLITLSAVNRTYGGSETVYSENRTDNWISIHNVDIYNADGANVFSKIPSNIQNYSTVYNNSLAISFSVSHEYNPDMGSEGWSYLAGSFSATLTDAFINKVRNVVDGDWTYSVAIENGRVKYTRDNKANNTETFSVLLSPAGVTCIEPAIQKIGEKLYVTWVQNGNELWYNVIDLNGTVTLDKTGEGSATLDLDYEVTVNAQLVTGHIQLRNDYTITKKVTFIPANMYTGGVEEVVTSVVSNTKVTQSTVYCKGVPIGYMTEGRLTSGEIEVYDNSNLLVNPMLIWSYYN